MTLDVLMMFLTFASLIVLSGLTLNLTENFGQLGTNSDLASFATSSTTATLAGPYETGLTITSGAVLVSCFMAMVTSYYSEKSRTRNMTMIGSLAGVANAAMVLGLVFNYKTLLNNGNLVVSVEDSDPSTGILRGTYGNGLIAVSSISLACTVDVMAALLGQSV